MEFYNTCKFMNNSDLSSEGEDDNDDENLDEKEEYD